MILISKSDVEFRNFLATIEIFRYKTKFPAQKNLRYVPQNIAAYHTENVGVTVSRNFFRYIGNFFLDCSHTGTNVTFKRQLSPFGLAGFKSKHSGANQN